MLEIDRNSIFNSENNNNKFWNRPPSGFEIDLNQTIQLQAKKKKRNGALKLRFYFLNDGILSYKKTSDSLRTEYVSNIRWSRVSFRFERQAPPDLRWQVILIKDRKFTCLYPQTEEDYVLWRDALRQNCLQFNFDEKFTIVGKFQNGENNPKQVLFNYFCEMTIFFLQRKTNIFLTIFSI